MIHLPREREGAPRRDTGAASPCCGRALMSSVRCHVSPMSCVIGMSSKSSNCHDMDDSRESCASLGGEKLAACPSTEVSLARARTIAIGWENKEAANAQFPCRPFRGQFGFPVNDYLLKVPCNVSCKIPADTAGGL